MKAAAAPLDLYRGARVSAWRLETLQSYEVPGDEARQRAFHDGEPLPPPRPDKAGDLELIRQIRESGCQIGRVHVVDRPLSDYVRYELTVYAENVAAGEDVRIADRSLHPELEALIQDFAIFDRERRHPGVILFDHDGNGRVTGRWITFDRKTVAACREQMEIALSRSVPLAEFTAAVTL